MINYAYLYASSNEIMQSANRLIYKILMFVELMELSVEYLCMKKQLNFR